MVVKQQSEADTVHDHITSTPETGEDLDQGQLWLPREILTRKSKGWGGGGGCLSDSQGDLQS